MEGSPSWRCGSGRAWLASIPCSMPVSSMMSMVAAWATDMVIAMRVPVPSARNSVSTVLSGVRNGRTLRST